jgi:hypothetical protein
MSALLHARLAGSLVASPDLIGLAGDVDTAAATLHGASVAIAFASSSGAQPSEATLREIEVAASIVLRSVEAHRLARVL